jgi:hypothetical protein
MERRISKREAMFWVLFFFLSWTQNVWGVVWLGGVGGALGNKAEGGEQLAYCTPVLLQ